MVYLEFKVVNIQQHFLNKQNIKELLNKEIKNTFSSVSKGTLFDLSKYRFSFDFSQNGNDALLGFHISIKDIKTFLNESDLTDEKILNFFNQHIPTFYLIIATILELVNNKISDGNYSCSSKPCCPKDMMAFDSDVQRKGIEKLLKQAEEYFSFSMK